MSGINLAALMSLEGELQGSLSSKKSPPGGGLIEFTSETMLMSRELSGFGLNLLSIKPEQANQ